MFRILVYVAWLARKTPGSLLPARCAVEGGAPRVGEGLRQAGRSRVAAGRLSLHVPSWPGISGGLGRFAAAGHQRCC